MIIKIKKGKHYDDEFWINDELKSGNCLPYENTTSMSFIYNL